MDIDPATFDEYIFPRKDIGTYDALYRDIAYLRNFLSNVIDLKVNTDPGKGDTGKGTVTILPSTSEEPSSDNKPAASSKRKQFQTPIDYAPKSASSTESVTPLRPQTHKYHSLMEVILWSTINLLKIFKIVMDRYQSGYYMIHSNLIQQHYNVQLLFH